ncbi:MAG: hypothetical protein MZV70_77300 [Desulfobacterales bacterium]|nr:hypothetical protein [Desulfobacterales bacterium]
MAAGQECGIDSLDKYRRLSAKATGSRRTRRSRSRGSSLLGQIRRTMPSRPLPFRAVASSELLVTRTYGVVIAAGDARSAHTLGGIQPLIGSNSRSDTARCHR